jgi:hypothetical protein
MKAIGENIPPVHILVVEDSSRDVGLSVTPATNIAAAARGDRDLAYGSEVCRKQS